jgi:hypothetical protein
MKFRTPISRLKKRKDGSETVERLKRWPSLAEKFKGKFVYIVSAQWGAYWRQNGSGYTDEKQNAGLYSIEDALRHTRHCGPEKRIVFIVATPEYSI